MHGKLAFCTLGLVVALTTACASDDQDNNNPTQSSIKWVTCADNESLECAELKVPMDYSKAAGEKIGVALIRKPATEANVKKSLLFNPGGPGISGIEFLTALIDENAIPERIQSTYHLVSFDPRGVGKSTPVECSGFGADDISAIPIDAATVALLHEQRTNYSAACSEKYGEYLTQLGSLNVIRDMDEIRKAMAEDKLNFIGVSYGTRLAALYLQEFPTTSGRVILDASVYPDSSYERIATGQLTAAQANLRQVFSQCTLFEPTCDVDSLLFKLNEHLRTLSNDFSGASADELELLSELIVEASKDTEFGQLFAETAYNYVQEPDIALLESFLEQLDQLLPGESPDQPTPAFTAQTAVLCADDEYRPSVESLQVKLDEYNVISDVFAEAYLMFLARCAGWPVTPEPFLTIAADAAPPSLVIGGTTDVQTPLKWSEIMSEAIGGYFIRSEHTDHGAVFLGVSKCVDDIAVKFLTDGLRPTVTDCPAEQLSRSKSKRILP